MRLAHLRNQCRSQLEQSGNPDVLFDSLCVLDPTVQKKYTDWILRRYLEGRLKSEDWYKVPDLLSRLDRSKRRLAMQGYSSDINKYESIAEIAKVLGNSVNAMIYPGIPGHELDLVYSESHVLYQDESLLVVSPLSEMASVYWGWGTQWCTAEQNPSLNQFEVYDGPKGSLVIFIEPNGSKFQMSRCGFFMDQYDSPAAEAEKARLFGRIPNYAILRSDALKHFCHESWFWAGRPQERLFCLEMLKTNGLSLQHLDSPDYEMLLQAVRSDGLALHWVERQDDLLCNEAIKRTPVSLALVKFQTPELCKIACMANPQAFRFAKHIDDELSRMVFKKLAEEPHNGEFSVMSLSALDNLVHVDYSPLLAFSPLKSDELCLTAYKQETGSIAFFPKDREDLILLALTKRGSGLLHLSEVTDARFRAAALTSKNAIRCVRSPTYDQMHFAVTADPWAIAYIDSPPESICLLAVQNEPRTLAMIREPAESVILEAVNKDSMVLQYVKNPSPKVAALAAETKISPFFL